MAEALRIDQAGMACAQDLGRPHGAKYGLPANGAMDQLSFRAANILARNTQDAALIEITGMDFAATATVDTLVSVTGARATVTAGGIYCPQWTPISLHAGQQIKIRSIHEGLRVYLAIHGSFEVPAYMGSVSPDPVLKFGTILKAGDRLPLRSSYPKVEHPVYVHALLRTGFEAPSYPDRVLVEVTEGPDAEEFGETEQVLYEGEFAMTERSNSIGLRLTGRLPHRQRTGETLSRGVPVGAIEVPPGNELLILHRGRGVTAGYPVLAVVTLTGLSQLAQVRPGGTVRFRKVSIEHAVTAYRDERARLDALETTVKSIFAGIYDYAHTA